VGERDAAHLLQKSLSLSGDLSVGFDAVDMITLEGQSAYVLIRNLDRETLDSSIVSVLDGTARLLDLLDFFFDNMIRSILLESDDVVGSCWAR